MGIKKANIVNIRRGTKQTRLFKNKHLTQKNLASAFDMLIPDDAYGVEEDNSKIDVPGFFHAEGQGFTPIAGEITDQLIIQIDTTSGTATSYGDLGGAVDGSNTVFTNEVGSYIAGTTEVYWNLQKQTLGVDYTETDPLTGKITFAAAPLNGTNVTEAYLVDGSNPRLVFMTTETGTDVPTFSVTIGGGETTFTLPPYLTASLRVFQNGAMLVQGSDKDWVETDPDTGDVTINYEVLASDVIEAIFEPILAGWKYETTEDDLAYVFNGTNTRGVTSEAYEPGKLFLYVNGLLQTPGKDYIETNPGERAFDTIVPWPTGVLSVAYKVGSNSVAVGERTSNEDLTSAAILTIYNRSVQVDVSGGAFTVTLPDAADTDGMRFNIIKTDSSTNAVTIGATVNGVVNPTLTRQYDSATMESDGTAYFLR